MDSLTQEQFTKILTHECRYDKVVRPAINGALNVSVQIDLKHIEAVEQLVSKRELFFYSLLLGVPYESKKGLCCFLTSGAHCGGNVRR